MSRVTWLSFTVLNPFFVCLDIICIFCTKSSFNSTEKDKNTVDSVTVFFFTVKDHSSLLSHKAPLCGICSSVFLKANTVFDRWNVICISAVTMSQHTEDLRSLSYRGRTTTITVLCNNSETYSWWIFAKFIITSITFLNWSQSRQWACWSWAYVPSSQPSTPFFSPVCFCRAS